MSRRTAGVLALTWLTLGPALAAQPRLDVVVSVGPLAQLVERLGGAEVRVTVLLPPGAAPENWSPTPREALDLARAQLYVSVGHPALGLEQRYLDALAGRSEDLSHLSMLESAVDPIGSDPHLWMDPDLMATTARKIAAWLSERLPLRRSQVSSRLDELVADIERRDELLRRLFTSACRAVVVQHPAWGRLLARYDVETLVIEADGKEPAPLEVIKLIRRARELGVETVFTQSGVSDRGARLVAREIGADLVSLDPLAADWLGNLEGAGKALALAAQ